jgi:hypothetical protein
VISITFKCEKCGNSHGRILADVGFDVFIKCEHCDLCEEMPVNTIVHIEEMEGK